MMKYFSINYFINESSDSWFCKEIEQVNFE